MFYKYKNTKKKKKEVLDKPPSVPTPFFLITIHNTHTSNFSPNKPYIRKTKKTQIQKKNTQKLKTNTFSETCWSNKAKNELLQSATTPCWCSSPTRLVCLFVLFYFKFDCLDLILWIYWILKVIHRRDIPRTLIHHRDIHHRDIPNKDIHNRDIPNKDILHLPMLLSINSLLLNNRVAVLAAWKAGNNNMLFLIFRIISIVSFLFVDSDPDRVLGFRTSQLARRRTWVLCCGPVLSHLHDLAISFYFLGNRACLIFFDLLRGFFFFFF